MNVNKYEFPLWQPSLNSYLYNKGHGLVTGYFILVVLDKENPSRWWSEDRENPTDEPLSLERALSRTRWKVHPEGFPILTSSMWLIAYIAYFLPKAHFNQMIFVLRGIWPVYRVGKSRLTSRSDAITTCVLTRSKTSDR